MEKEKKEELTFEIEKHIGIIKEGRNGWNKELNLVSWNGNPAKYDIREWNEAHNKMRKGITLTEEEMQALVDFFR